MISMIFTLTAKVVHWWQAHSPINRLIAHTRTPAGFKWTIPALLLAAPLLLIAGTCHDIAKDNHQPWLNLIVVWALYAGFKVVFNLPFACAAAIRRSWVYWRHPTPATRYGF